MESRQGSSLKAAAADFEPVYEWLDGDGKNDLRVHLPGFKKEDFQVRVDATGRLTIMGQRPAKDGAGSVRLSKMFQLPPTSDPDGITGWFVGGVLMLTVPKLPSGGVAPPAKEEEYEEAAPDGADKPTADHKSKIGREAERLIEAMKARLAGRQREDAEQKTGGSKKPPPAKQVDQVAEPKAEATLPTEKSAKRVDQDDSANKVEHMAKVSREAERRIEEAKARLAAAREKSGCWKERAADEGLKWAEAIGNNKEVIATAVAAFTLGMFVSHRLFNRN